MRAAASQAMGKAGRTETPSAQRRCVVCRAGDVGYSVNPWDRCSLAPPSVPPLSAPRGVERPVWQKPFRTARDVCFQKRRRERPASHVATSSFQRLETGADAGDAEGPGPLSRASGVSAGSTQAGGGDLCPGQDVFLNDFSNEPEVPGRRRRLPRPFPEGQRRPL